MTVSSKMMADVVESFLAALVLDQGLMFAQKFCEVCIFPKLLVRDGRGRRRGDIYVQ